MKKALIVVAFVAAAGVLLVLAYLATVAQQPCDFGPCVINDATQTK